MNDRKSIIMIVSSMLVFGTIGVFRRYIPISSAFLAFSRGILGGLFLLAFVAISGKGTKEKLSGRDFRYLAITGALIGINWILLFEAFNYTTVGIATLCYYMQPTIVVLLSPIIFKEVLTGRKLACAICAILGMVPVSGVLSDAGVHGGSLRGILLGLGAALFYSAVVILNKKISGVDAYQRSTVQLLSAGVVMVPYLLLTGDFAAGGFTVQTVLLIIVVGIVHTGIAYALYFGSMDGLRVQSIALLSYIDPVSALLFSAFLLGEGLSLAGLVGAVMIIGSAVVSELE